MDAVLMRLVDTMRAFPSIFLLLAVIAILEPNIFNIMVVIGLTSWLGVARLVRAEVLSLNAREFVLAALMAGRSPVRAVTPHLPPDARDRGPVSGA